MVCKSCGAPLKFDAEFCEYCGAITEYGEKVFKEREKQERTEEKITAENLPEMRTASMLFVFIMYVITLGLYSPYWYLSRSVPMKKLHSTKKFPVWLGDLYVMMCAAFFVLPFNYIDGRDWIIVVWFFVAIEIPIVSWQLGVTGRKILQQHAQNYNCENQIAPSGFWVFLFGAAYLQYNINKMVKMKILAPKI